MAKQDIQRTRWNIHGKDLALALLLAGMLVLAYVPALNGSIVWDDNAHITKPVLRSFSGLVRIWTDLGATQQYYPLLHSTFWLEQELWGDNMVGYHVLNLFFHFAAALLLVAVLKKLYIPGAWLAGFLFALHPVNVESVAWISEQKNTLSAVFFFGAALAYLEFDQTRKRTLYWIASGLFVAALATKSVTAMLPLGLLIVLWWRNGKVDTRRDLFPLGPWVAIGAAAGLFTAWVERHYVGAEGATFSLSLLDRCLLAGRVIWFYLLKLVMPVKLMFVYPHWKIDSGAAWQYLFPLAALALLAALVRFARRNQTPLAGYLFFVAMLIPVLGFLNVYPFRFSYVADHFQYLATLGVIVPCAAWLAILGRKMSAGVRNTCATVLCGTLFVLTWAQSGWYRDAYTLYTETLQLNPDAWMPHNELGLMLGRYQQRLPEAVQHLQEAARLQPESAEIRNNLGVILSDAPGKSLDAIAAFQDALKIRPGYAEAHNNLGTALSEIPDRKAEAIAEYEAALRVDPNYAEAHNNLGSALSEDDSKRAEAILQFKEALRLNPSLADAHANLGIALSKADATVPEAERQLEAALQLRPDMQQVRMLLQRMQQAAAASKQ